MDRGIEPNLGRRHATREPAAHGALLRPGGFFGRKDRSQHLPADLLDFLGDLSDLVAFVVGNTVLQVLNQARILAQRDVQFAEAFRLLHRIAASAL